jgi:hypothetical protein
VLSFAFGLTASGDAQGKTFELRVASADRALPEKRRACLERGFYVPS